MEVELAKQLDELYVVFGLRCLSVLRYLTDHIGVLSLGVLARSFSKFAQKLSTFVWYVQNDYNWWSRHGLFKIVFETLNILSTVFIPSDSLKNRFCVQNFQKRDPVYKLRSSDQICSSARSSWTSSCCSPEPAVEKKWVKTFFSGFSCISPVGVWEKMGDEIDSKI